MHPVALAEMRALEDHHWWFRGRRRAVRPLLRRALEAAPEGFLLDLGCGTGGNLAHLAPTIAPRPAVGLDPEPAALSHCRARGLHRLTQATATRLPFADGSVALATAFDVLEHLEDDVAALSELRRVLAPGGQLVASVPCHPSLWSPHDEALGHRRRYRSGELERKLASAGFTVEERRGFNLLLLPAVALVRSRRRRPVDGTPRTDFVDLPAPIEAALGGLLAAERVLLSALPLPFGVSLLVRARGRPATSRHSPPNSGPT